MNEPKTLDYAAVAALTGLTPATLRRYRTIGLLPEPDASAAADRPRWTEPAIRAWMAERPGRGRRRSAEPAEAAPVEPKRTEYAEGYQAAMGDVARAWTEGGPDAAAEWIGSNLLDREAGALFAAAVAPAETAPEPAELSALVDGDPWRPDAAPVAEPAGAEPYVCEWAGHDDAMEEHGWCPVCQEPDEGVEDDGETFVDFDGAVRSTRPTECGSTYVTAGYDPSSVACELPPGHDGPHRGPDPLGGDRIAEWRGGELVAGDRVPTSDVRREDPTDEGPMRTVEMRAEFARVKDAVEFAARYLEGGNSSSSDVKREGRFVTWTATTRSALYEWDLLENVGYVGTYGGRTAKLNDVRAPRAY